MIICIHQNAQQVVKVLMGLNELEISNTVCTKAFWELAEKFPEEIIAWCEEKYSADLNLTQWPQVFHQDLIMASYAVENTFLSGSIGYIDQLPFVHVNRKVLYPTWQMSSDVGGIKGETLLKFKSIFEGINNFDYLLNSIGKIGQQNGLFCYSAPGLVSKFSDKKPESTATSSQLFSFVYSYYNTIWISVLLWCYWKYENKFSLKAFLQALMKKKRFLQKVDLAGIKIQSNKIPETSNSIDVIIPTMGRPKYLMQVIKDLSLQSLLPKKVIVVEQNLDVNSISELPELGSKTWPFEITHHFIHQTGACNARNIALEEVDSDWVFFADDDIRFEPDLLEKGVEEINLLGVSSINMNCKQKGEKTIFKKIKQWGSFGSGTSIVKSIFAKQCAFSSIYEHGYGEDADFGMQLRNVGCDIIYHPEIEILHLKAPMGGFREKPVLEWEQVEPLPKPSPTLMAFALKYYTPQQIKGFKTSLFLKYYTKQSVKNPFAYVKSMRLRWRKSEEWAEKLRVATKRFQETKIPDEV
ncbi:glycosyltransferase family 2 protein [Gillisia limnaea]|uniref:Glycosyl transferase family 2 n=1 Tax=Gillisia limnaea (strain DSM 15749 / LMG 21470 / R-8282) TaxID=865937 RepID=H2BV68_GILLR|nr:glycosyltransferase family A protein [Gillisia limnaea]EHQ01733.1 glycosyl transferase family 2 [Gillisia limnaea DSM 15749]